MKSTKDSFASWGIVFEDSGASLQTKKEEDDEEFDEDQDD